MDTILTQRIRWIDLHSRCAYGAPRIHAGLVDEGLPVGRKRVAGFMCAAGLRRKPSQVRARHETPGEQPAAAGPGPTQLHGGWPEPVSDCRYHEPLDWTGNFYLAVVMDAWSRRVVGWAYATHLQAELVLDALEMAIHQRRHSSLDYASPVRNGLRQARAA